MTCKRNLPLPESFQVSFGLYITQFRPEKWRQNISTVKETEHISGQGMEIQAAFCQNCNAT